MFRENSNHNQTSIFQSTNWMSTRVKNKLENVDFESFGYDDKFVKHGSVTELEKLNGIDVNSIVKKIAKREKIKVVV